MIDKIIFLGTSAGMPTNNRNVSSLAVLFDHGKNFWLFDCGEGTQQQLIRAGLKLSKLNSIFITHLHGDHLFGLPGLLATRGLQGVKTNIDIFGPIGLQDYLRSSFEYSETYIPYHLKIHQIEKEKYLTKRLLWKKENHSVFSAVLDHQMDSFGYMIISKEKKSNILPEQLIKLGIQPGPIYKDIKEKRKIILKDGRVIDSDFFIKTVVRVKKICYCGDTVFSKNAIDLSRNADILIHEATFSDQEEYKAKKSFHSTIGDAINIAKLANVKKLVLTHISPRYERSSDNNERWDEFQANANSQLPETIVAYDFLEIKI
ncbi:MAG: ribonuclease Z [Candidatus Atribacteria bacterium]|nr:ribonuclease Z [Candidatus Atribacteria bacterium]